MPDSNYAVRQDNRADTPVQLLGRPVTSLLTVNEDQAGILKGLGIETIQDLGASLIFGTAAHLIVLAGQAESSAPAAGDYIDANINLTFGELAEAPLTTLRFIDEATAAGISEKFGLVTLREAATWPPYTLARRIVSDALGFAEPGTDDPERPEELVPVGRRYATERVEGKEEVTLQARPQHAGVEGRREHDPHPVRPRN